MGSIRQEWSQDAPSRPRFYCGTKGGRYSDYSIFRTERWKSSGAGCCCACSTRSLKLVVDGNLLGVGHGFLGVDGDCPGVVRYDRLIIVEHQFPRVEFVTTVENGVGHLTGIPKLRRQPTELRADSQEMLGEETGEEGAGLVPHADDLHVPM